MDPRKHPTSPTPSPIMQALPNTRKNLKDLPIIRPHVYDIDTVERRAIFVQNLRHYGVGLVWPFATKTEAVAFSRETVLEIWSAIVEDLALRPDLLERLVANGFVINDEKDLEKFMGVLPKNFLRELYAILGKNVYLHCGFGAPSSNRAFNLRVLWKLRQNAMLDAVGQMFLETDDTKCSLDRPICKLNGKGEQELLHLDKPPFSEPNLDMISMKFCTGEASFICVPESHKWTTQIKDKYSEFYKDSGCKWGIDPLKPDALDLYGKTRCVIIPANACIVWLQDVIHGVTKNSTGRIAFGLYVGFSKDAERAEYEKIHKVNETEDRFRVFSTGVAPKGFPSCDTVQTYPLRFQNFPKRIGEFTDKMDKSNGQYGFAERKLKCRDEWVPHLVEYPPIDYTPPVLSKRGRELLVGKKRVREFFGDQE